MHGLNDTENCVPLKQALNQAYQDANAALTEEVAVYYAPVCNFLLAAARRGEKTVSLESIYQSTQVPFSLRPLMTKILKEKDGLKIQPEQTGMNESTMMVSGWS